MGKPKASVSKGTISTPPPSPTSEPSIPATIDPAKISKTVSSEKWRCCMLLWLAFAPMVPGRKLLSRRIASTKTVITTKRRSPSNAKTTMDTATRMIGVAISSRRPSVMIACGCKVSKPTQTWPNVCGKLRNLCTERPPGRSGNMRKPSKMILALRMTPPRSTQLIMFAASFSLSAETF